MDAVSGGYTFKGAIMEKLTTVKDSGKREEFETGAVRDTSEGKGRFELISPIFLTRLAKQLEAGAKKYSANNWTKGMPVTRCMDSALRHLNKYIEGHRDEDHLAAAAFNVMAMIHIEEMVRRGKLPATLIDWPNYLMEEDVKHVELTTEEKEEALAEYLQEVRNEL